MINCWHVFLFLWLSTSSFAEAVDNCSLHVQPTVTVVVAGDRVDLNCTVTSGDFSILSWQIGTVITNRIVIYTAPQYGRNGTVKTKKYVADGYSVNNTADKTTSLLINQINISQSGLYVCVCGDTKSSATAAVVVLASEPQFAVISNVAATGKPVSFSCDISFNGSADISSNLTIKDASGTTVNRTVCYSNNHLTPCALNYTFTANVSVDQWFTCSVHLFANNSTIYSRILNTSLYWEQVKSAEIVMSNPSKCFAGKCVVNESLKCMTDGNPGTTSYKWWQIQDNGSKLDTGNHNQTLVLTKIGRFTYQCQVYSTIRKTNYNVTSKTFAIIVTANDNSASGFTSTTMIVVIGISVAIGIVIVVIAIFVTRICCSRRETKRQTFRALSTQDSSVPPPQRQPTNRYDKTKVRDPGQQQASASTSSNHPAASSNDNKLVENELVLFDNELYGGTRCASPNPVAPSVPEENIYNEIGLHTLN